MLKILCTLIAAAYGVAYYWWLSALDHQMMDEPIWAHRVAGTALAAAFMAAAYLTAKRGEE